jgi:DNA ligase-1
MKFMILAEASERIRATSKKKEKIALIARILGQAKGREIYLAAHYLSGNLPSGRLGIGWRTLQDAVTDPAPASDSVELIDIQAYLDDLAGTAGSGSLQRKKKILHELFSRISAKEKQFLIGLLMGEIRQGALESLVLAAVAQASGLPAKMLGQAHMFSGNIGEVAEAALKDGAAGLARFGPRLFYPISPMLANPAENEQEALTRLGEAALEFKLDGARIQVHKAGDKIKIFTRHLKDVTARLPEIVSLAGDFPLREAIFEGEAIALRKTGKPFPFQVTMRRFGRILEVERMQKELPLTPFFFDLLYLDGQPLFDTAYRDRVALLAAEIPPDYLIPSIVTADETAAGEFFHKSLQAGHEGLLAKGLESPYVAGQRGSHWLKIKPVRTLDLVVLAAEWGHGRRKGWLSNLHLAARDPESGQFVMLGKTFKGLTDRMLGWMTDRLLELETHRDRTTVYVRPELVVEIAYSDLQESPRYPGGLALRFARIKGFRSDKSPAQADTIQTIRAIFENTTGITI